MRRLIVIVSIICFLFTTTIELACLANADAQPPPQLEMLHLTECHVPCWANIIVGKTRFNDAKKRLLEIYPPPDVSLDETYPGSFSISPTTVVNEAGYPAMVVGVQSENDIVNRIWVRVDSDYAPSLGDIISLYGPPHCSSPALIAVGEDTLIYEFPTLNLQLGVAERRPQTPVTDIIISNSLDQTKMCTILADRWRGFSYSRQ